MQQSTPTDVIQQLDAEFGARVAEVRKEAGLSQRALAGLLADLGLQIDPSAITRLERGERTIRLSEARLIALALETTLAYLLDEEGEATPEEVLAELRDLSNQAMQSARGFLATWISRVSEIQDLLRQHPHLVELLRDQSDEPPEDVEHYVQWVVDASIA